MEGNFIFHNSCRSPPGKMRHQESRAWQYWCHCVDHLYVVCLATRRQVERWIWPFYGDVCILVEIKSQLKILRRFPIIQIGGGVINHNALIDRQYNLRHIQCRVWSTLGQVSIQKGKQSLGIGRVSPGRHQWRTGPGKGRAVCWRVVDDDDVASTEL